MVKEIKQAVILAGGLGTRLKPFTDSMPKAMYPINNKPFIDYLLEQIRSYGIRNVVILLGYLSDKIVNYVGNGNRYDLNISYDVTPVNFDTGDRLLHAKCLLDDNFLLMYCDNYCPIDFDKLVSDFFDNKALIQLSIYNNYDNYTKSNVMMVNNKIVLYDKSRSNDKLLGTEIGYAIVNKKVLDLVDGNNRSFSSNIYPKLANNNELYGTSIEHRYYSIGSYDRINLTNEFFKDKKVVFLDRDGTLNKKAPRACYIEKPEYFVWLDGAMEAVKILKDNGYITILVTNQPGIARGNLDIDTLNKIHEKMQRDLSSIGASIDYIYYCPHNWNDGCNCRKPKPGLLYQAQKDLSLDLTKCFLFGDDKRDMEAAKAARLQCQLVSDKEPLIKVVKKLCRRR